jgi:hypothetical protein
LDADCKVKVQQGIIALAPKINISGPTRNTNTADNLSDNTYMDLVVTVKTNKHLNIGLFHHQHSMLFSLK